MRDGCLYTHRWKPPGSTSHCCQACKKDEMWHSKNCHGYGTRIIRNGSVTNNERANDETNLPATTKSRSRSRQRDTLAWFPTSFTMPYSMTRFNLCQPAMVAVESLASLHGYVLASDVRAAWQRTQLVIEKMATCQAQLRVHVCKLDDIPSYITEDCIDVHTTYCLQTPSTIYDPSNVTGVNPVVQAHLITQATTAKIIEEATIRVEMQRSVGIRRIAFACTGGTHRSMACGCLLVSLVYPQATLIPCSKRTRIDANIWMNGVNDGV